MFPIFIQFKSSLDTVCREVDHDFARRRSHEAMDAVMGATLRTAESLTQLQSGTAALTAELQNRIEHSSSAVLDLLSSHSQAESTRFQVLSDSAAKLEAGQSGLLTQLESQSAAVRALLHDAQTIQLLINATTADIKSTQQDILALQGSTVTVLDSTRADLIQLKQTQQQHFEDALQSLHVLHTLSATLHTAHASSAAALSRLAAEQEQSFLNSASQIAQLHSDQTAAFEDGAARLNDIRQLQSTITAAQHDLLAYVKLSSDEVRISFEQTGSSLHRIQQQASEVESKIGTLMLEMKAMIAQLMNLNIDVLTELFHIQSAVFYVALTPIIYFATATDRTKAARFWLMLMLICALLFELNLVSATSRFHFHLSQPAFDSFRGRLRYALSVLSGLGLTLAALLHRDYDALNHALHTRNTTVLDNNHRMLHELIRRTERLSRDFDDDDTQEFGAPNPFQQPTPRDTSGREGETYAGPVSPRRRSHRQPYSSPFESGPVSFVDPSSSVWPPPRHAGYAAESAAVGVGGAAAVGCGCQDQPAPRSICARLFAKRSPATAADTNATTEGTNIESYQPNQMSVDSARAPESPSSCLRTATGDEEGSTIPNSSVSARVRASDVEPGSGSYDCGVDSPLASRPLRRSSRARSRSRARTIHIDTDTCNSTPNPLNQTTITEKTNSNEPDEEQPGGQTTESKKKKKGQQRK